MAVETGTFQLVMPAMGDSVAEGTILEWQKQEGDRVAVDDIIVEISTDKVDAEVPTPVAGTIVKLYGAEGDTVEVGAPLAEISLGDDEAHDTPSGDDAPEASEAGGETVDIVTPGGGESVTEGTILEWSVGVGDAIKEGDTVVEISTDKVDMELPSPATGTITEVLFEEGATVNVGDVIARMVTGAGTPKPAAAPSNGSATGTAPVQNTKPATPAAADANATPVAQRVAAASGVSLSNVPGTGPRGRITKDDVLNTNGHTKPVDIPDTAQKIKGGGAVLARYMDESRSIPTATSFRTLPVTTLDNRRKQLKAANLKVSFTHLIAYAIAKAATDEMPVMAHHFLDANGTPYRVDDGGVNLGLAVDVEKKDGTRTLMVPVIRDAGRLDFKQFLDAYNGLVEKARTNTLTADDLAGANISLTNPGGIGTIASVPRLMVGQGTIVATGSIAYPVGLGEIGAAIGAEKVMSMTSTYDHRIIQGAESGRFLKLIEDYLQGQNDFYEGVFRALGVTLPPLPERATPGVAAPAAAAAAPVVSQPATTGGTPDEELLQAVQAATSLVKAYRTHGHLAARLDPLNSEPTGDPACGRP